jgi:lipid-A-disaccharide synthase
LKYYLIAGERSGDLHGGNLIKALRQQDPDAQVRCWGGDAMQAAGGELVVHYRETSFMGFWEVFKNLRTIRRLLKRCQRDLLRYQPDALVLIDYPGFNLRMAKFAKQHGLRVFYYISPKVWAWNQSRAKKIKATVDHMYVILPFEKAFYQKYDYKVEYVGNPLFDAIRDFRPDEGFGAIYLPDDRPVVGLLPGSRQQEITLMLEIMLRVADRFPNYHFMVAAVDNVPASFYDAGRNHPAVTIVMNKTYDVLHHARAAIVTSGTATLETALFGVPQLVTYRMSPITYQIARRVIRVPYISLVNLVAERAVVPELIQKDFSAERITELLPKLIQDTPVRQQQLEDYRLMKTKLGDHGASETVAKHIRRVLTG